MWIVCFFYNKISGTKKKNKLDKYYVGRKSKLRCAVFTIWMANIQTQSNGKIDWENKI